MNGEITLDICGRRIVLAMPLGAWEELARAGHDKPLILENALRAGQWTTAQMMDSLGVALKHGGSGLAASEVVAAHGLMGAASVAHAAIMAGLVGDEGDEGKRKKKEAPGDPTPNGDSA
jgi:hypothetical protein